MCPQSHKTTSPFTPWILIFTHQQQTSFENIVGKGGIAHNKQFLLFPQCFLLNQIIVSPFVHIFDIISLFAAKFKEPKISIPGKMLETLSYFCLVHWIYRRISFQQNPGCFHPTFSSCTIQWGPQTYISGDKIEDV